MKTFHGFIPSPYSVLFGVPKPHNVAAKPNRVTQKIPRMVIYDACDLLNKLFEHTNLSDLRYF